jgi:hypothetical protein
VPSRPESCTVQSDGWSKVYFTSSDVPEKVERAAAVLPPSGVGVGDAETVPEGEGDNGAMVSGGAGIPPHELRAKATHRAAGRSIKRGG